MTSFLTVQITNTQWR